jgi:nucleoporin GLE1
VVCDCIRFDEFCLVNFRASDGGAREKAFVMRVGDEDDTEDEDGFSDGESRALVANGARFFCNDLESR